MAGEDLLLLGYRQPGVQRQYLGVPQVGLAQEVGGIADFPLAGQEHQRIARRLAGRPLMGFELAQGRENTLIDTQVFLDTIALLVHLRRQRAVPDIHREGTARHFDNRRIIEVGGETLQIDGRRGDDHLEVRPLRQDGFQIAQQEIDIQAALMGLIDDQRVIARQEAVILGFRQQDAIGHQLDQGALVALIGEAHLEADQFTQRRAQLLSHPAGDTARGKTARLGVANQAMHAPPQFQTDLRQLGGLARAGFSGDHHHLAAGNGALDLVPLGGNRQAVIVMHTGDAGTPCRGLGAGCRQTRQPGLQARRLRLTTQALQLTQQAVTVSGHGLVEIGGKGVEIGHAFLSVKGMSCGGNSLQHEKAPPGGPGRGLLSQRIGRYAAPSFFSSSSRSSRRRILPTLVVGRLSRNSTSLGTL